MSDELKPCDGCNGRGEVGGLRPDGYHTEPCPFCNGTGHDAPSPSVGADGLPEQLVERLQFLRIVTDETTLKQIKTLAAALASRPVGDGGAETTSAQIEAAIAAWFTTDAESFEDRMRAAIDAARTAGTDTAGGV